MENRKIKEKEFHNRLRGSSLELPNEKFYSITQPSREFIEEWLKKECMDKQVLDYCCGDGKLTTFLAKNKANVAGIDISEVSIKKAKENARKENVKINFVLGDAENTTFSDNQFDIIYEFGSLHHLDLENAYKELARILKPEGKILCIEALKHNPMIHFYRKLTSDLRTKWETNHILGAKEIGYSKKYFKKSEILGFFHLTSLFAVPFRNTIFFKSILKYLKKIDSVLLKLPFIKWQAWQIIFVLSKPIKNKSQNKNVKNIHKCN